MDNRAEPNPELVIQEQDYGDDPIAVRETGQYRAEYVQSFVEKWDELIDWEARAESEGRFFVDVLRSRGVRSVLDVAAGTGFHSVRLIEAGFDVTTCDGNAAMLARAFENGKSRQLILKTVQSDWRWLTRDVQGTFDAIICLGNSFTHLFDEHDRRRRILRHLHVDDVAMPEVDFGGAAGALEHHDIEGLGESVKGLLHRGPILSAHETEIFRRQRSSHLTSDHKLRRRSGLGFNQDRIEVGAWSQSAGRCLNRLCPADFFPIRRDE